MALVNGTSASELLTGFDTPDNIYAGAGNDTLRGGAGNDTMQGQLGNDRLFGEAGNDYFDDSFGTGADLYDGGAGNDVFRDTIGKDTLIGGTGNDYFLIDRNQLTGTSTHTGAEGVATGGAGVDRYEFGRTLAYHQAIGHEPNLTYTITDFSVTGPERDVLVIDNLLIESSLLGEENSYQGGNPFAGGYLRLVQSGADTLLRFDGDGTAGENTARTVVRLKNVDAGSLTAANFEGGIAPDGSPVPGDLFTGTAGADTLQGTFFNDTINGSAGNDTINGSGGNDIINAGGGNDSIYGGAGNDTMNGSTGDDFFTVDFSGAASYATGGDGQDTYMIEPALEVSRGWFVTDFTPGEDVIDVYRLLLQSARIAPFDHNELAYTGGNPFELGYLRLVDFAGGTRLQWDHDGFYGPEDDLDASTFKTVLTLQGVSESGLTAADFLGIPPDGSEAAAQTLEGAGGDDYFRAGIGDDDVSGNAGADILHGNAGDDTLDGGTGNDTLIGGIGDDLVLMGDGNDNTFPYGGRPGVDHNVEILGNDTFYGGDGNDFFYDTYGDNLLYGENDSDTFHIQAHDAGVSTIFGGAAQDRYEMLGSTTIVRTVVADFVVGAGGDVINVSQLLNASESGGYYSGDNPLTAGFLRLRLVSGGHTVLEWDLDGAAGTESAWVKQVTLLGITPGSLTADNFVGELVVGTAGNDELSGALGEDTVQGLAGNDTLDGSLGADILEGGAGNDLYYVDHVGDEVIETSNSGALVLPGPGGTGQAGVPGFTDTVFASINYTLGNYLEHLTLSGAASTGTGNELANKITGNAGTDTLDGGAGNDTLNGGTGNDQLLGGEGNDTLVWGVGDTLDAGAGVDNLKLSAGSLNLVTLTNSRILNVESINMVGGGNNTLTLNASDVLAINLADTLKVLGNAGDKVIATGFIQTADSLGFHRYTSGGATLLVEQDVTVVL